MARRHETVEVDVLSWPWRILYGLMGLSYLLGAWSMIWHPEYMPNRVRLIADGCGCQKLQRMTVADFLEWRRADSGKP